MNPKISISLQALLEYCALIVAGGFIVVFIVVALWRLPYPFELEWMEGSVVDHVQRVIAGLPVYVAPSLDFVPFGYPPLYYWVSAAVAGVTGLGFEPLRLTSLVATLGSLVLLLLIVKRETGGWRFGLLAAGVFAATYRVSGAWFDLAREDSLFLLLVLAAVYLVRFYEAWWAWVAAGIALAAATLTKQVAVVPAAALIMYGVWRNRRKGAILAAVFVSCAGAAILWLNVATDGWFWYYVFAQPAEHAVIPASAAYFICRGVCLPMGIATLAAVLCWSRWRRAGDRKSVVFWSLVLLGMAGASALPLMKEGGAQNSLIPVHAALAAILAVAAAQMTMPGQLRVPHSREADSTQVMVWVAVLIQLAALGYRPSARIPTRLDEQAGRQLIARMAATPGDVLLFSHGHLPLTAGKKVHANYIAVTDVLSTNDIRAKQPLLADIQAVIRQRRFSAIILDSDDAFDCDSAAFAENYRLQGPVFDSRSVFWPVSGSLTRPEFVYVPRVKRP